MALARRAFLAGALLVLVPACGLFSSHHRRDANRVDPGDHRRVSVEVSSHNWSDITVYLIAGGLPQRLGRVSAMSNATFDFPSQRLNTSSGIRLRALPLAGRAFTSETILVQPGQVITWVLENDLDTSSLSVY
jgi:hypothetical protein